MNIIGVRTVIGDGWNTNLIDREIDEVIEVMQGNGIVVVNITTSCSVDANTLWIVTQLAYGRADEVSS